MQLSDLQVGDKLIHVPPLPAYMRGYESPNGAPAVYYVGTVTAPGEVEAELVPAINIDVHKFGRHCVGEITGSEVWRK
jgi:hypothetical protein